MVMALTDNTRGALFMVGSMTCFTVNDAFMKSLADDMPLVQAVFLRGVATTCLMLLMIRVLRISTPKLDRRNRRLFYLRNVAEVSTAYLFLSALFNMPIANASAILQALPLTVTLAGAVFLGQTVGWRRALAIAIGFIGVMLIVRPGLDGFTIYSLYALGAVVTVTIRDIIVRLISADIPSFVIGASNAKAVTFAFGIASLFVTWSPVDFGDVLVLTGATLTIIGAYTCAVAAMRVGDIAVISPFRYSSLLAAMLLGFIVFGEVPDALTFLGAGIVVATGLYTLWRERQVTDGDA